MDSPLHERSGGGGGGGGRAFNINNEVRSGYLCLSTLCCVAAVC